MTGVPREWRDVWPLRKEMANRLAHSQAVQFGPAEIEARLDDCHRPHAWLALLAECRAALDRRTPASPYVDDLLRRVDAALTDTEENR